MCSPSLRPRPTPALSFPAVAALAAAIAIAGGGSLRAQSPFNASQPPLSAPYGGSARGGNLLPANPGVSGGGMGGAGSPRAEAVNGMETGAAGIGAEPLDVSNIGPDYRLRRGDVLSYQVREDRDPQTALQVSDSGEFVPPYLGRSVQAAGKTVLQLQNEVRAALERELYVHASVQMGLMRAAPRQSKGRVYMTGFIRTIGPLDLPTDETLTVSKAILRAGGFKDFANTRKVKLLRANNSSKIIYVDVKAVLDGKPVEDPVLQPGDTIDVRDKTFNISF